MNELQRFLNSISDRLEDGAREEADLELKRSYEVFGERERHALFEVADLLAALSNDTAVDGYRALVLGPAAELIRPAWLSDEAALPDRLRRCFEGAVQPRVEVARRDLPDGRIFDAIVVVDRSETPYVTRDKLGGVWVVRTRATTGRRTATRSELMALCAGSRGPRTPVRQIHAAVRHSNKSVWSIVVTNVGTVAVENVTVQLADDSALSFLNDDQRTIELLKPGEKDALAVMSRDQYLSGRREGSERVVVRGRAEDGEGLQTEAIFNPRIP